MGDISKTTFSNALYWKKNHILIQFSQTFVRKGLIYIQPALAQAMDGHRAGDKPLPEPMLNKITETSMGSFTKLLQGREFQK